MSEVFFDYQQAIERLDGDEEFLRELLYELVEQVDESWSGFEEAISSKDHETLRRLAHSIKGAAANLNVDKMAELFAILESLGRSESFEGVEEYIEQIRELNESLRSYLNESSN